MVEQWNGESRFPFRPLPRNGPQVKGYLDSKSSRFESGHRSQGLCWKQHLWPFLPDHGPAVEGYRLDQARQCKRAVVLGYRSVKSSRKAFPNAHFARLQIYFAPDGAGGR